MRHVRIPAPVALFVLALAGCAETHVTRPANLPPRADTPQGVVKRFAWCWNNLDVTRYSGLFTDDFQFVFASGDSVGDLYRETVFGRDEMLACAQHLFVGGGTRPAARSITLVIDAVLYPLDDSRPGKNPRWHQEVSTSVSLTVVTVTDSTYHICGNATFFAVRGDSAAIPAELGLEPDSTRWYIERWEDYTLWGCGAATRVASPQASRSYSWGYLLHVYQ